MHTSMRYTFTALFLSAICTAQSDLTELNLEDLGNVKVTSASRKSENLSSAPAAIYVLTADAITIYKDGRIEVAR